MKKVMGTLYGHAYGDAVGARLEFGGVPSLEDIEDAMALNGGGVFRLAPGQVTDDTELTIQTLRGLIHAYASAPDGKNCDVTGALAVQFVSWFKSKPFDVGNTTRNAFDIGYAPPLSAAISIADVVRTNTLALNRESESNGALMRCIPHALFAYLLNWSEDKLYKSVETDVSLTHVKPCVVTLCFAYCVIIVSLLKGVSTEDIYEKLVSIATTHDSEKLEHLLENCFVLPDVTKNIGWDKHAFALTLYFLFTDAPYEDAIRQVVSMGGDTDTNAAIVGGVLGAKYGVDDIPLVEKLIACKPKHNRNEYHPMVYKPLMDFICKELVFKPRKS